MRSQSITLLAAAALLALAAFPALADGDGNSQGGNNNSQGGKGNNQGPGGTAVPGPIAGAGLGYLVLAGGYYVARRWRKQETAE